MKKVPFNTKKSTADIFSKTVIEKLNKGKEAGGNGKRKALKSNS